jgi:DNA-binding IclR family transcriptional regulator
MVPALDRTMQFLRLLARAPQESLSVTELRNSLKFPRASFFRLLSALLRHELIAQDSSTGAYRLGPSLMALGFVARERFPLAAKARPILREISSASHQMSELVIGMGNWRLLTLEVWTAERTPLRFRARGGMFFPLQHLTAHGLVFLSCGSDRRRSEYLKLAQTESFRQQLGLPAQVPPDLSEQCQRWRRSGFAWRRQSVPIGNARIAVPVFDPHSRTPTLLGSLGIACPSDELTSVRIARWATLLQHHARNLERKLV